MLINLLPKIKLLLLKINKQGKEVVYTIDYKYNEMFDNMQSKHRLTFWIPLVDEKGNPVVFKKGKNKGKQKIVPNIMYFDNQIEILKYLVKVVNNE
ncbi:MAG: hypothetical protein ACM3KR_00610 [Deltaproteobacteria bacterium]